MSLFQVGMTVRINKNLWEPADEHSPAGIVAFEGDLATIISNDPNNTEYPLVLSL